MPELPRLKSAPEVTYDALKWQMDDFQQALPRDMELAIIANGPGLVVHIEQVALRGQTIVFDGVDDKGREARLVQHHSQVNVLMIAVNKQGEEARRIGF